MEYINKHKDIVIDKYTDYDEDDRLKVKHQNIEFITTIKYIEKYAKKGCKILEIGAGTGAYSIYLAKLGYNVTAVELVEYNLNIMKEKSKDIKNITCLQGDALNLSCFDENEFDIVLNLGPMYHIYNEEDKNQAIDESLRVCKQDGISMFAYLTHGSIIYNYGVRKNSFHILNYAICDNGAIRDIPKETFTSYFVEDFKLLFKDKNINYLKSVATDGLFPLLREKIDNELSDENYKLLVDWHLKTCERLEQQGYSSHMLYICQKNNNKK